eukprot:1290337-Rhodomonas_salina.5
MDRGSGVADCAAVGVGTLSDKRKRLQEATGEIAQEGWSEYWSEDDEYASENEGETFERVVREEWSRETQLELARLVEAALDAEAGNISRWQSADYLQLQLQLAMLQDEHGDERLAALSFLLARFEPGLCRTSRCSCSTATAALRFLCDRRLLDLSSPIACAQPLRPTPPQVAGSGSEHAEAVDEADGDHSAFPSRHWHRFSRACVRQLHHAAPSTGTAVACPLCRGTVPEEYLTDPVHGQLLVDTPLNLAPTAHACLRASRAGAVTAPAPSVRKVLAGVCAEFGLLAPLCWVEEALRECGGEGFEGVVGGVGCNVIHLAAKHGHLHVVKWGCQRGLRGLAAVLSAELRGNEGAAERQASKDVGRGAPGGAAGARGAANGARGCGAATAGPGLRGAGWAGPRRDRARRPLWRTAVLAGCKPLPVSTQARDHTPCHAGSRSVGGGGGDCGRISRLSV